MKRYILHIITVFATLLVADMAWGDTLPTSGSLASKTYTLPSNQTQLGTLTVPAGVSATIELGGKTLDGNAKQIFNVLGTLTIKGIGTITNGNAANGGCAYITGKMTITNATIKDCFASTDGGAFYVNNGTLIIENGELSHNSAERLGGAICKAGTNNTLTIQGNTKFRHNSAKNSGGAIYARTLTIKGNSQSDPVVIEYNKATNYDGKDPTFTQNSNNAWVSGITGRGGGIYIPTSSTASEPFDDMKCDIEFCNIQYNYAAIDGGGIYSGINTDIDNSKIIYNTAMSSEKKDYKDKVSTNSGRGGGFYFVGYYRAKEHKDGELIRNSTFELTNTEVKHNAAMYYGGGGQLGTRAILTMSDSQINNNRAVIHGAGGLHLTADVTFNFESGEINNNEAYTVGGGIHTSYGCTLNLNGGSISGNIAHQRGGGVHVNTGGSLVLNGTNITDNEVYQGKDMAYATVIKNSDGTFTWDPNSLGYKGVNESGYKYENNDDSNYLVDTGYGGGVLIDSGTCTMNTGLLSNNYAKVAGGGLALVMIRISDSESDFGRLKVVNFQLNEGTISNNQSDGNGAGVYLMRNKISEMISQLSQSSQETLKAHANYQTLTKGIPTATIVNGVLESNEAGISGASIMMEEGNFYVNGNTQLENNKSVSHGGGVHIGGGSFSVNNGASLIANNNSSSTGDGGAIYLGKGAFTMTGSAKADITKNSAKNGGAIFAAGNVTLTGNTNISNNTATQDGGAIYLTGSGAKFVSTGDSNIESNTAENSGGAIYLSGNNAAFSVARNASISLNKAINGDGGAIYLSGTNSAFTVSGDAVVGSNSSKGNGGAVYVEGGNVTLAANTINGNSAKNGGAIYLNGGGFTATGNTTMSANAASGDGGAVYVQGGNINITGQSSTLNLSGNNASNGGAFYVNNGSITTSGIQKATISDNYSAAVAGTGGEGGAFYVSNGNINMCKTDLSGNGKLGDSVKTTNGGAIALYNGVFSFADGSEIKNNAATGNGGGLYVLSSTTDKKTIKCIGGSYLANSATLGGGIYASGLIDLTIAANVRGNAAVNGGGLYLTEGINMTFGYEDAEKGVVDGLIVDNSATRTDGQGGVGGGIYVDNGTLSFYLPTDKAKQKLGIYNNVATYEAADIFSSGVKTTVVLPNVGGMNLTDFDVPGSTLYWVKDVNNNRYQTALMNLNTDIAEMILGFGENDVAKTLTEKQCLDLGYDLVYVTLRPVNLGANDNAALEISYPLDKDNPDVDYKKQYRKILLQGNKDAIVGLPSGLWNMNLTEWAVTYDQPSFTPAAGTNGFVNVTRESLKPTDGVITVTFKVKEQFEQKEVLRYDYIKVNKMTPKVAN